MKARKISNPFYKGNQAARKMQVRFFLSLMTLIAFIFVIGMLLEPASSSFCLTGFAGTSFAAMMVIGDIEDVSDRKTHGSNIAYKAYLIEISQINPDVAFPKPNSNREVGTLPMKAGQYMKYFEAHDIPTYTSTGEKGDITTSGENNFVMIMGGMRDQLLTFIEEHAGGKFIIIFKEVGEDQWYILGNYDRPMVLSSYESKNDKDGRYVTFTFKRTSIDQYYKYAGDIIRVPAAKHTADSTTLAISPQNNRYEIPNGSAATTPLMRYQVSRPMIKVATSLSKVPVPTKPPPLPMAQHLLWRMVPPGQPRPALPSRSMSWTRPRLSKSRVLVSRQLKNHH